MNSCDLAIKKLAAYLKAEVTDLQEVYADWPDPKDQLKMPCASIISAGTRGFRHQQPEFFKKTVNEENPDLDDVVYTIGQYDYTIQLDLWAEYKPQRGSLYEKVHDALNKQFLSGDQPCGLSLAVEEYHGMIARFDQVGYTFMDSEESSQRSEWRVKIDVLVTHSKLAVKTQSRMQEIIVQHQVSDTTTSETNQPSNEETYELEP